MQFLRERKLMKARKLLINHNSSSMSVKTAAIGAGIYDLNRFSKNYKEMFGELPSETLKKIQS
jgi:AraC family ethanolamine operon transcriptional activator